MGGSDTNIPGGQTVAPRLLSLDDTARTLGRITVREIYKRVNAEDLELVKIGRRSFITVESIEAYVARLRQEAAVRRESTGP